MQNPTQQPKTVEELVSVISHRALALDDVVAVFQSVSKLHNRGVQSAALLLGAALSLDGNRMHNCLGHVDSSGSGDADSYIDTRVASIINNLVRLGLFVPTKTIVYTTERLHWLHVPATLDRGMFHKLKLPLTEAAFDAHKRRNKDPLFVRARLFV
jgi:hypothetical protein